MVVLVGAWEQNWFKSLLSHFLFVSPWACLYTCLCLGFHALQIIVEAAL